LLHVPIAVSVSICSFCFLTVAKLNKIYKTTSSSVAAALEFADFETILRILKNMLTKCLTLCEHDD